MEDHEILNENEVSKWIRSSKAVLRRWRREGKGPRFMKLGRLVRYRVRDIKVWLDERSR